MSETWTLVNGECFFCHKTEHGYALKDDKEEFQPACWQCCKDRLKGLKESM